MFCRPCYEQYYQKLKSISFSAISQCIITGSPGIGKSFFYLYVAQRLLEDEELNVKRVLMTNLSSPPTGLLVLERQENGEINETFKSDVTFLLGTTKEFQVDKNTWLLMDGPNKSDGYVKLPTLALGFNVWFLSPNMNLIRSLEKSWTERLYMPLWSRNEIILANRIYQAPPDELMSRYNFFGGIARWVFDPKQEIRRNLVQEAVYSSSFLKDLDSIGASNIFLDNQSHLLFVIEALSMESFEVQFASSEIEDITIAAAEKNKYRNLLEFIRAAAGIKELSNIRGRLFERYAHRILTLPCHKFKCKVFRKKEESEFKLGDVQVCHYRIIKDDDGKSLIQFDSEGDAEIMYSIPVSKTRGTFDSFLRNIFFQITVNTVHDIKVGFIEQCLELRGMMDQSSKPEVPIYDCIELWFVVPDDRFDNFSTKRPFKLAGRTVKVGGENAPVWLNKIQQGVISIPISSKICDTLQKLQKIHN